MDIQATKRRARPVHLVAASGLALLVLALAPAGAFAAADETTAAQINPGHTGFASGGSLDRPPLRTRWTRSLGTSTSYPLVAGGRTYVIGYDPQHSGGTLVALDNTSGATLWSRSVAGSAQLAYDAGRVFISESSGTVVAVSAASGVTLWTRNLPESFMLQSPVAADGTVYVDSAWSGGRVWALDGADGTTDWQSEYYSGGSPGLDGRFVYLSEDYQGTTAAFSRADGSRAWSSSKQCNVNVGRVVADGARVIAPYTGGCGAVSDAATGTQLDSFSASAPPAIAGDVAVVLSGTTLQARSISTGLLLWQFSGDGRLRSAPVIVNETIYAGSASGTLFAVDLRTGAALWTGALGATDVTPGNAGIAAGGGLLVVPTGGTVTALESVGVARPGLDLRITSGPDGPTNTRSATLTFGSGDPLAVQMCRLDNGAWLACLGSVTYASLPDGPHVFEVQTRDPLSGQAIALATRGWSVDTNVPAARITSGPTGTTNTPSAHFLTAADDPSAGLECRLDDRPWAACGSTYSGNEYYPLSDGTHRFEARARDGVGNVQATPVSRTWTIDTRRPVVTIDSGPRGSVTATDATFTFSADEPSTFRCSMDSAPLAACASPFAMSGVSAGTHTFTVVGTDAVGNIDWYGVSRTWTVGEPPQDTTAPETRFVAAPPAVTAATSARFMFAADEYAGFECRRDGAPWNPCGSTTDVEGLADGEHQMDARAIDMTGNIDATPASWRWTVDTRAPQATASMAPGSGPHAGYRFTFEADEPATTFACGLDGGGAVPCASGVSYAGLADGPHEFRVLATDAAGNSDAVGASVPFTVARPPDPDPEPDSDDDPPPADPPGDDPPAGDPAPGNPPAGATPPGATAPGTTAPGATAARGTPPASATRPGALASTSSRPQLTAPALARMVADATAGVLRSRTRRQLRDGARVRVYLARAGSIAVAVTARRNGRTIIVARAQARFVAPGARTVRLRLTPAGRRALAGSARRSLRVRAKVRPALGAPASASASARV